MPYFEMAIINGMKPRTEFDIQCNDDLYNYLCGHENSKGGEDWFAIKLNETDVANIQELCKTNEEKRLIAPNIKKGAIIDVLIHRTILIKEE